MTTRGRGPNRDEGPLRGNRPTDQQAQSVRDLILRFIDAGHIEPRNDDQNRGEFIANLRRNVQAIKADSEPDGREIFEFKFPDRQKKGEFFDGLEQLGIEPENGEGSQEGEAKNPTSITLSGYLRCSMHWYWLVVNTEVAARTRTSGYEPTTISVKAHSLENANFEIRHEQRNNEDELWLYDDYTVFGSLRYPIVKGTHDCWYPWGQGHLSLTTLIDFGD